MTDEPTEEPTEDIVSTAVTQGAKALQALQDMTETIEWAVGELNDLGVGQEPSVSFYTEGSPISICFYPDVDGELSEESQIHMSVLEIIQDYVAMLQMNDGTIRLIDQPSLEPSFVELEAEIARVRALYSRE